jgi:hypothetical protein
MNDRRVMLLSDEQQRIYVDAIFAMAALDGFEVVCTTAGEGQDRPVMCARQIGNYRIEVGWSDEHEHGPDATKATWDLEVTERDPASGSNVLLHCVALHAADALRMAKGLVHFYQALTLRRRSDVNPRAAAITSETVG